MTFEFQQEMDQLVNKRPVLEPVCVPVSARGEELRPNAAAAHRSNKNSPQLVSHKYREPRRGSWTSSVLRRRRTLTLCLFLTLRYTDSNVAGVISHIIVV